MIFKFIGLITTFKHLFSASSIGLKKCNSTLLTAIFADGLSTTARRRRRRRRKNPRAKAVVKGILF
jgi:hypothetical protein